MYRVLIGTCIILMIATVAVWYPISKRSEDIAQLSRFAAAGNADTPRMVDEHIRLDSVSVEFPAIVFKYTIVSSPSDFDIGALQQREQTWFTEVACNDQAVRESVLDKDYRIVRSYTSKSRNEVLRLDLGPEQCLTGN